MVDVTTSDDPEQSPDGAPIGDRRYPEWWRPSKNISWWRPRPSERRSRI